jgi:hypothetical protein
MTDGATLDRGELSSYYGRPILKEPVWKPEIPTYFFTGGLAGASSILSLGARVAGNERLAKTSLYVGLAAEVVSPALLVSDLGRPERFLNMLRVFKVTSPMSVGSWILMASGGATSAAAACEALGILPRLKLLAEGAAALFGAPLTTYTATLLSDTAIPVWHEARRELPFVFGTSALATAGAAATLLLPPDEAGPARRLAILGSLAETLTTTAMERRLGFVGEPYHEGVSGRLLKVAGASTRVGAALLARRGRRSRAAAVAGSTLVLGGGLALRWAVFKAGFASARDPRYTVEPQRERRPRTDLPATGPSSRPAHPN